MTDTEAVARAMIAAECEMLDATLEQLGPTYTTMKPTWEMNSERYKAYARAAIETIAGRGISEPQMTEALRRMNALGVVCEDDERRKFASIWSAIWSAKLEEIKRE